MIDVTIGSTPVRLLGDTHLGKKFEVGVPLHRRGDREAMQWADFERSLMDVGDAKLHIQVGDIFDRWAVPYEVILRAASLYKLAAKKNPGCRYAVLRGNHDASRDIERVSAFKIFSELVRDVVSVADDQPLRARPDEGIVLVPWHPIHTAAEMVALHAEALAAGAHTVVGHWDVVAIGENPNLLPAAALRDLGIALAITGHDHIRRGLVIDDLPVLVTGSMQPYSFAEDPEERLYVTLDLETARLQAEQGALNNKCVRIELQTGEILDFTIDCLQLKLVHAGSNQPEGVEADVTFEPFSFENLLAQAFAEEEVDPRFIELSRLRLESERARA